MHTRGVVLLCSATLTLIPTTSACALEAAGYVSEYSEQERPSHLSNVRPPVIARINVLEREYEAGQPCQALKRSLEASPTDCGGHLLQREVLEAMQQQVQLNKTVQVSPGSTSLVVNWMSRQPGLVCARRVIADSTGQHISAHPCVDAACHQLGTAGAATPS